jgi:rhodanese-related sulfurtransferase
MLSRLLNKLKTTTSLPGIAHEELQQAHLNGTCTVIDVREAHEYASGHIPGAINHPLSQFDPARIPHGKPVVLICQAGARSAAALQRALAAGRQDVRHYPGGITGWRARGGSVGLSARSG